MDSASLHGYLAPRGNSNPEAAAKEEIQQAVFSQEELHDLPVECQTQFFKGADSVHLSVVTHVGVEHLKFRKVDGRNQNTLTIPVSECEQGRAAARNKNEQHTNRDSGTGKFQARTATTWSSI
jgi:hypothetical protein